VKPGQFEIGSFFASGRDRAEPASAQHIGSREEARDDLVGDPGSGAYSSPVGSGSRPPPNRMFEIAVTVPMRRRREQGPGQRSSRVLRGSAGEGVRSSRTCDDRSPIRGRCFAPWLTTSWSKTESPAEQPGDNVIAMTLGSDENAYREPVRSMVEELKAKVRHDGKASVAGR